MGAMLFLLVAGGMLTAIAVAYANARRGERKTGMTAPGDTDSGAAYVDGGSAIWSSSDSAAGTGDGGASDCGGGDSGGSCGGD